MRSAIGRNSLGLHHTGLFGVCPALVSLAYYGRPAIDPAATTELIDMSREYLRQETLEPAKRLGRHAGMGAGRRLGAGPRRLLPDARPLQRAEDVAPVGVLVGVLVKFLTALVAAGGAGLVAREVAQNVTITRQDIEAKANEIASAVNQTKDSARDTAVAAGVAHHRPPHPRRLHFGRRRGSRNRTLARSTRSEVGVAA